MPTTAFMGGIVRRREDPRLITGSATYVGDIVLPGMAHVAILRSPYPHARILGIDTSAAAAMPGVVAVITGEEVRELVPEESEVEGEAGPPPRTPLAVDVVRYVGDPVAAVVADTAAQALDALEQIVVDYDALPSVADPEAAMEPSAPQIHGYADNNVDNRRPFTSGDPDKAFAEAEVTISLRMVNQRLAPNPMETRGVVAQYEFGGQWTVWSSTQCAHYVREGICQALKVPQTRVRAIAPEVGGGFGCKGGVYPEEILLAYLAQRVNRPVKWIEGRSEHMQSTVHGRSQIAYLDLAATREGKLTGLRLRLIVDSGAYGASWAGQISASMVTGAYLIPNIYTKAITVLTNKTYLGAYRGAGRPEAAYYIERGMDALARKLDMEPAELRRRNFIPTDAFPFQTPDGWVFDSGQYDLALDAALERSGYERMREEQARLRAEGRLIGIGLASYVEVCGFGWETSTVRMEADGAVSVYTGISPHGQGQETTFAQMAADVLGVRPEQVTVRWGDTAMGSGNGTGGSRGTAVGGPAVYKACADVREKMRRIAAHMLEAAPEDLELRDDGWGVTGVPGGEISIAQIAQRAYTGRNLPEGMEPGLTAVNNFRPENVTVPNGTHIVLTEVDRDTGKVEILTFVSVDDCGTIVSPQLVEGQVHGGLAQGISQALFEEVVYDEAGGLLTGTLVDYGLPTAADLPSYSTSHTHTPSPRNDLGIKGIGEAATIGSTPAVVNAVVDALAPLGIEHIDMPLTPARVWEAIQEAEARSRATTQEV